jgi:hypothetical protein
MPGAVKNKMACCDTCIFLDENEQLYSFLPATTVKAFLLDPYKWNQETSPQFAKKCNVILSAGHFVTRKIVQPNLFHHDLLFPF